MVGAFWVATKVGIEGRLGDIEASCSGCIFIGPRDFDLHQGMNDNFRVGLLFGGTAQEKRWNLSSAATRSKEEIKSAATNSRNSTAALQAGTWTFFASGKGTEERGKKK